MPHCPGLIELPHAKTGQQPDENGEPLVLRGGPKLQANICGQADRRADHPAENRLTHGAPFGAMPVGDRRKD